MTTLRNRAILCGAVIFAGSVGAVGPLAAEDGFAIDVNGQHLRIGVPRDCTDERCVKITTGRPGGADERMIDGSQLIDMFSQMMRGHDDDEPPAGRPRRRDGGRDRVEDRAPPAPPVPPASPAPGTPGAPGPVAALPPPAAPPSTATPSTATPATAMPSTATPGSRAPVAKQSVAALPPAAAGPTASPAAPPPTADPPLAAPAPAERASPVGVWLVAKGEGRIRIAPCGANLCGYEHDADRDGTKILIDMKPMRDGSWRGRVRDPRSGGLYDATMTQTAPDRLAIRGCAMAGFLCQGQTWTRG